MSSYVIHVRVSVSIHSTHSVVNLGKPSSQRPLKELKGENGVEVQYIEGGMCVKNGTHEIRYTTRLLLICNRNVPIVSAL